MIAYGVRKKEAVTLHPRVCKCEDRGYIYSIKKIYTIQVTYYKTSYTLQAFTNTGVQGHFFLLPATLTRL